MHHLKHKNALADPSWEPLGTDVLADGLMLAFTDGTGANGWWFYRVALAQ